MKRILLNCAASLFFIIALTACSSESAVDTTTDTTAADPVRENRSDAWSGVIGEDKGNGVYEITADKAALLADMQANVDKEGATTTLENLTIVKKTALNDGNNSGFMLIAGDGRGLSVGVMLTRGQTGSLKLDDGFENPKTVSCWGCATGCNLEYLYIDGKKVPICNENGCVSDCTKKETELK